ncbi:MAG: T9SS type A sorting domain-containing protein [Crocinitomicaceae bacterium]|nr:T9SS type A sorting domain-containing protein [Crocinitomicaceae bacterium]
MKYLISIAALSLLFSCGSNSQKEESGSESKGVNPIDYLMSEGTNTSPGSRYEWEQMRLANPATGMIPANIRQKELAFAASLPAHQYKAFNWDQRGPYNVGGRTRAIAIDVLDENIWLAAGVSGGIWRSEDAGQSWTNTTDPLEMHSYTSIVQDTRAGHESTWYAGTGEHYAIVSQTTFEARFSGNGIMKSTDNGVSWDFLPSTQTNTPETYLANGDMDFTWRIVTDPTNTSEDVVLAAVFNGVKRSADGGASWTDVLGFGTGPFSAPNSDYLDLVVTPNGIFYATLSSDGPDRGIYRSDDGGITWTDIKPNSGFASSWGRLAITINPDDENVVWFFGVANSGFGNGHGIYRYQYLSGDGTGTGGTWDDRSSALPNQSCLISEIGAEIGLLSTQNSFDVHLTIHPVDTSIMFIAGTSIWRNMDGFTHDSTNTWIGGYHCDPLPYNDLNWGLSYENHHPDQHYLMFLPSDPNVLVNSNDGGVYRTVDNLADTVEWVSLNNGYVTSQFYAIAIEPGEVTSDIVIGGLQDNGTWFTNTAEFDSTWKYIGSGDGMYCAMTEGLEYYVTCLQRGKMFLQEIDSFGVPQAIERLDPEGGPTTYNWANSLKQDPNNDHRIFWNGRNKLWRLDDFDDVPITGDKTNKHIGDWIEMDSSKIAPQAGVITDIEMCKAAEGVVWYGTTNGYLYKIEDAYELVGSAQLTDLSWDDWPMNAYISCISVDPFNEDKIIVTFANYEVPSVWRTTDGGITWTDISGNLEENPDGSGSGPAVAWAEYYVDGTLFVGTTTGLYTTNFADGLNTVWTLESGIGNVSVDHMDFRPHDGYFVVATHGQGVYSTHLTPGFISTEETAFDELNVYPTITADIVNVISPKEAHTIELYNLQGQKVISSSISQSQNSINIGGLKSGTYILVAKSDSEKWTKKVMKR